MKKILNKLYKFFEEKIKSDEDAEITQIKEGFQKEKREKENIYKLRNKESKDDYDTIVSDAKKSTKILKILLRKNMILKYKRLKMN